jgi:cytoskeleton protein RodZ
VEPELTPLSLGELLRRGREKRGLTPERVSAETHIRRAYVDALERDDLSALPAPVFTRGLVRTYAVYLGLSPTEALELLNKEEARPDRFGVHPTSRRPQLAPTFATRAVWTMAMLLGLATLGGLLYLGLPTYQTLFGATTARAQATAAPTQDARPSATPSPAPTARPIVVPSPTGRPSPSPTVAPSPTLGAEGRATATAAAGMRGVTIEARASARVWSQIESDGQVVFAGILMPGEKRTWKAEKGIVMHAGDGALIEVTVNGRALGPMGDPGEVVKAEWLASR